MFQVNALGKACPLPVIETRKALKEHDAVQTLVDNRIATENLQKMARQLGCSCSVTEDGPAHYTVVITKGEAAEAVPELKPVIQTINKTYPDVDKTNLGVGSTIFAVKPGDGSAREQAASCQKVLGGWANIANEYATKRYRSNLINWGMLPFLIPAGDLPFKNGDFLFFPGIRKAVEEKADVIKGYTVDGDTLKEFEVTLGELTDDEREIILKGCLINYNRK